jgi:WD repeat-containing protein mio
VQCFAWSPDPLFNDLVAVGTSTGRVDLMRLGATRSTRNGILSSGNVAHLPARSSRPCNALAFSSMDPNYLAVGLDKVRGDSSLVVWDIQSTSISLALPSEDFSQSMSDRVERPQPAIAKSEIAPRVDPRVLQQQASAEAITALSFLPKSTSVLLAGISHRWLRLLDLRTPSPNATNVVFNKVQSIVTDPFDEHRFACIGDGLVSVWDARRLPRPLLMFSEKDALADGSKLRPNPAYSTAEFSSTRRGVLATLEKDGSFVRFWDTIQTHSQVKKLDSDSRDSSQSGRAHRKSWANLPWSGSAQQPNTVFDAPSSSWQLSLSNTRKSM